MDRLTSLMAFTRVVESEGFSAASRGLGMSVTMVSNHVKALEDHLGARLLNRTTRRISLTDTGRAYYDRAVQILAELAEADQVAGAQQSTPRGALRVYASASMIRFLRPVVAEFLTNYRDVSIDLLTGERQVDLIDEGYDLAVRTLPSTEATLISRNLTPWRHFLACSPDYLKSHPPLQHPRDLAQHNCMRYAFYPFAEGWRFENPAGEVVSAPVTGNLTTTSAEALRVMAMEGHGLIMAPSFLALEDLQSGRLVRPLPDYRGVELMITAVYPTRHHVSAKVRVFIDRMAEFFTAHRQWLDPDAAALGAYA
jgi:DNA-binding transcriptional LysR family regulator